MKEWNKERFWRSYPLYLEERKDAVLQVLDVLSGGQPDIIVWDTLNQYLLEVEKLEPDDQRFVLKRVTGLCWKDVEGAKSIDGYYEKLMEQRSHAVFLESGASTILKVAGSKWEQKLYDDHNITPATSSSCICMNSVC